MDLDNKQKVLLALYTEYQKDLPMMRDIKADTLGLSRDVFNVAIEKLQNEGFIRDAAIAYAGRSPYPYDVRIENCKMTRYGIEYVESKLQIEPTLSGAEKTKGVAKKVAEWGWDQGKDFVAKVLAEVLKSSTGVQ
ncbi:hypothetical protein [Brevibacillus borstelensis]